MAEIGLFEAIYSARAIRRFKPDPVPDDVITKILDAAIRAPSGSNAQNWEFIVVKDAAQRKKIGDMYRKGGGIMRAMYTNRTKPPHMDQKAYDRLLASASTCSITWTTHRCCCSRASRPSHRQGAAPQVPPDALAGLKNMARIGGSSIYPAVQNIILACRAFGLGTVLTTIHVFYEEEVKAILGLPPEVHTYALMPIGYPRGKFGPIKRRPVNEVAYPR